MVSSFSYPSQYVYRPSMVSEQMMGTNSNRSRSESGSSDSSRGSGSTESGKSRRRSHRPRGCRGGSNRRRNNGGEGKLSSFNKPNITNADFNGNSGVRGNKLSHRTRHSVTSDYESSLPPQQFSEASQFHSGGAYDYSIGKRDTFSYDFRQDYSPNLFGADNGFYSAMDHQHHGQYTGFSSLQPSFSESSNEILNDQEECQILPPMPTAPFQECRPRPTGPNPYALNLSVSTSSTFIPGSMNYNSVGGALLPPVNPSLSTRDNIAAARPPHPPGILKSVRNIRGNNNLLNIGDLLLDAGKDFAMTSLAIKKPSTHHDTEYRAERLEKQRQNVVGGSLFATSPRSFLMGVKSTPDSSFATTSSVATKVSAF
jgi:hypothetical protein